jgi:hypothetical protein
MHRGEEQNRQSGPSDGRTAEDEPGDSGQPAPSRSLLEQQQEEKNIRRLQLMMNMVMSVIAQDGTLSYEDASEMIADSRRTALSMFPDKELAYDLIYKPKLQRLMRDRFRLQ